ncbi:MAG: NUDIX pyrophosphatase [Ignavibacteriae bacterium]|nr:MAG: NUDIX pyrophosphatase [Ignavibacteriota bacterium]
MKLQSNLIEAHIIKIKNDKIQYLLLKRSENKMYPNVWQMVTGKIAKEEKAYETAIREIKEETNLNVNEMYIVPNVNSFYSNYDDSITLVPVFAAIINDNQQVKISGEHQEYKWVDKEEAIKLLAWPGQAKSVKIIEDYFTTRKENLKFIKIKL